MQSEQVQQDDPVRQQSERATEYMFSQLRPDTARLLRERELTTSDPDLEKNIGRHVVFVNELPPNPRPSGWRRQVWRIIGVQKIFDGSHAYRVLPVTEDAHNGVGKPARPDETEFVEGDKQIDFSS